MGCAIREKTVDLGALPSACHFFQWAMLCEEYAGVDIFDMIKPTHALGFSVQDFKLLTADHVQLIEVNFLSLLGAMSPLPHHLCSHDIESEAYHAFIHLLNRIFYRALYAAWKSTHAHFCQSHRGMYHDMFSPIAHTPWLSRPFVQHTSNLSGLRSLLHRICYPVPVSAYIESCYRDISVGQALLGSTSTLSNNAILGSRLLSHQGQLRLRFGPLPCSEAKQWLPTEQKGRFILSLLNQYGATCFAVRFEIGIDAQITQTRLGAGDQLSRYAFLGKCSREIVVGAHICARAKHARPYI